MGGPHAGTHPLPVSTKRHSWTLERGGRGALGLQSTGGQGWGLRQIETEEDWRGHRWWCRDRPDEGTLGAWALGRKEGQLRPRGEGPGSKRPGAGAQRA